MSEAILGEAQATVQQAQAWAKKNGARIEFIAQASLFFALAPERGVRPEVAYCQSAHETGFGHFGGVISQDWKNPAGLKITAPTGSAPSDHMRFPTWAVGISAQLDHLALYAGAVGYPRHDTADQRHFPSLKGKAAFVRQLGGNWAPGFEYGLKIEQKIKALLATP